MGDVSKKRRETRAARNIRWIETFCVVPEGKLIGQPVRVRPWQRKIINAIYDGHTRRAIISFARKNGKTALAAWLLLLHLCGPEAKPNSQLYSTAMSKKQAAKLYDLAVKTVRMSPVLANVITTRDSGKELACPELGTVYEALSAEAKTAHGASVAFVVHDELGQVRGPRSELYEAVETGSGAQEEPLSVIISTQAPNDNDLLSIMIDDAQVENDRRTKLFLFTADENLNPFTKKAMRQANPAYGDFQNEKEIIDFASDAKRMTSLEPAYRNLYLNQRVEQSNPLIAKSEWKKCGGVVHDDWGEAEVFAGLDLSSRKDLTAFVLMAKINGFWEVKPFFWTPGETLAQRALKDRVQYDVWHKKGFLQTCPGKAVQYEWVAEQIAALFEMYNIIRVNFDDWKWDSLRPWLVKAEMPEEEIEKFNATRQGFKTMSAAVDAFEDMVLEGRLAHANHPVLSFCVNSSTVLLDPAGNRKIDKSRPGARIDGAVALAMASSAAALHEQDAPEYQAFFI